VSRELDGIKVLDLSQFLSGPRCAQLLADRGADVVKVEPPGLGETMRRLCVLMRAEKILSTLHRGKRGIAVDLKTAEGRALLHRFAATADVVVAALTGAGLPCSPVSDRESVNTDPQLAARQMLTEVPVTDGEPVAVVGDPLSGGAGLPAGVRGCPRLGEHTDEVLREWLGSEAAEIAALRDAGTVG